MPIFSVALVSCEWIVAFKLHNEECDYKVSSNCIKSEFRVINVDVRTLMSSTPHVSDQISRKNDRSWRLKEMCKIVIAQPEIDFFNYYSLTGSTFFVRKYVRKPKRVFYRSNS